MQYCEGCKQLYADDDPNGCKCSEAEKEKKLKGATKIVILGKNKGGVPFDGIPHKA